MFPYIYSEFITGINTFAGSDTVKMFTSDNLNQL